MCPRPTSFWGQHYRVYQCHIALRIGANNLHGLCRDHPHSKAGSVLYGLRIPRGSNRRCAIAGADPNGWMDDGVRRCRSHRPPQCYLEFVHATDCAGAFGVADKVRLVLSTRSLAFTCEVGSLSAPTPPCARETSETRAIRIVGHSTSVSTH